MLNLFKKKQKNEFNQELSGVHISNEKKVCKGYRLFDGILINTKGEIIKKWNYKYLSKIHKGDYFAQKKYEGLFWGKFDLKDYLIYKKKQPIHHELTFTPKGNIITLTKEMHEYKGRKVDFCIILELDKEGNEITRWSTWDHFEEIKSFHLPLELERPYHPLIPETAKRKTESPWGGYYDYYRLNSLQVLPKNKLGKKDKRFQEGNWLISFRHGSMIFILDKKTKKIVWKAIFNDVKDNLEGAHSPRILENGNILIFDNGRYRKWSRVIELNPINLEIEWEYKADNFYSESRGFAQRLRNGNTLITESEKGRSFEITPLKEIVWEYFHPDVQDETNSDHEKSYGLRQWIYRMTHYDKKEIERYL